MNLSFKSREFYDDDIISLIVFRVFKEKRDPSMRVIFYLLLIKC